MLWETLRLAVTSDASLLPSSVSIVQAAGRLITEPAFWRDFVSTAWRAGAGLISALAAGLPAGMAIAYIRPLRWTLMPIVDALRSIPVSTLYPVVVLTLGIGNRGKIGMVFIACVLVITLHSATGFDSRSRVRQRVARLYGVPVIKRLFGVALLEALPSLLTGTRVSLGLALIVSTLTEMFMGARTGLGQSLMEAYSTYDLPRMYAYIAVVGLIGYGGNSVLAAAETRIAQWNRR